MLLLELWLLGELLDIISVLLDDKELGELDEGELDEELELESHICVLLLELEEDWLLDELLLDVFI